MLLTRLHTPVTLATLRCAKRGLGMNGRIVLMEIEIIAKETVSAASNLGPFNMGLPGTSPWSGQTT